METSNATLVEEGQSANMPVSVPAARKLVALLTVLFTLVSVITEIIVDVREWGLDVPSRRVFLSLLETMMTVTTIIIAMAARRSLVGFIIAAAICGYFSYTYIYPLFQ